jgi:DUF971 family protein
LTPGAAPAIYRLAMGFLDQITFKKVTSDPPQSIEVNDKREFLVAWPGVLSVIPALQLRDACPCATCIEEGTGRKLLDPATIPADIRPLEIRPVGSYAIQIQWSDGHGTGIYSWETLRRLSGVEQRPGG